MTTKTPAAPSFQTNCGTMRGSSKAAALPPKRRPVGKRRAKSNTPSLFGFDMGGSSS